jgi:WD40 repeat protein
MTDAVRDIDDIPWAGAFPGGLGVLLSVADASGTIRLASAGSDHTIRIWDVQRGVAVGTPILAHDTAVWALTSWIDNEGRVRLASSAEDAVIRIWDPLSGEEVGQPLTGHIGWVSTLASWRGAGGDRIASGGFDGTIRIWDPDSGMPAGPPLLGHTGPVLKLFHWCDRDGNRLASTSDDGTIRIWDADRMVPLGEPLAGHGPGMWGLTGWTTAGGAVRLAAAGMDGVIQVWDPYARTPVGAPWAGHRGAAGALTAWRTGDQVRLASLGADGAVRLWDPDSGRPVAEPVAGATGWLPALASWVEADGSVRLACGSPSGTIRVWDFATGQDVVAPLGGHTSSMWALTSWSTRDGGARLATGGDDAVIRIWNADTGALIGEPLTGHTAGIWALASWSAPDGAGRLASAGDDAAIRIWDSDTGQQVDQPLTGHVGWITALAPWIADTGAIRLASAGIDGTIRVWDPERGVEVQPPLAGGDGRVLALAVARSGAGRWLLAAGGTAGVVRVWDVEAGIRACADLTGHAETVRGLTGWTGADGSARFASASFDGTVRVWDPERGTGLAVLTGHAGQVARVVNWPASPDRTLLASGGDDGTIRIWDPDTGTAVEPVLVGHTSGVWALTWWLAGDGRVVLASAGEDGTVRLWDPVRGCALRTIEVGPVTLWGLSDAPSPTDVLGRQVLAAAVAEQLLRSAAADDAGGPLVVSVEGPWGCGKTTFMKMVRDELDRSAGAPRPATGSAGLPTGPKRRLTVRRAVAELRARDQTQHPLPGDPAPVRTPRVDSTVVTAWFNPWVHESGEQVWAGLVHEVIEAAGTVLFPDQVSRERYWFSKNIARVDRFALRLLLLRRTVSPLLGVALAAVIVPLAIAVAQLNQRFTVAGQPFSAASAALVIAFGFLAVGIGHTAYQYRASPVADYLPGEMLYRPVRDGLVVNDRHGPADQIPDPLHRARAGSLYLYQHDVGEVLTDLSDVGYQMVIFIDDLDRCRIATTVEVFEAINIFLAGLTNRVQMQARFVIGLDPDVVAGHLGASPGGLAASGGRHDVAIGWSYLRKLIQLPVVLPRVSDGGVEGFMDQVIGRPSGRPAVGGGPTLTVAPTANRSADTAATPVTTPIPPAAAATPRRRERAVIAWRTLEQHPEVRAFILARLAARPNRSIRDAKRLLNVWQLTERVLTVMQPGIDTTARIHRAKHLVLLAEAITRWPSLQSSLNSWYPGGCGWQLLAAAAADDQSWRDTVAEVVGDRLVEPNAIAELRAMLVEHDGLAVARLAAEVF